MIAFVLFMGLTALASKPSNGGQDACPCIGNNDLIPENHPFHNTNYGLSCRDWDSVMSYCDPKQPGFNETNMAWCQGSWCYVDPDNCSPVLNGDAFEAQPSVISENELGLWYSYQTCGSPDEFGLDSWDFEVKQAPTCECAEADDPNDPLADLRASRATCAPHNSNDQVCDIEDDGYVPAGQQPAWCPHSWCLVQKGCVAEREGRKYYARQYSIMEDGEPDDTVELYYSYEQCGSPDLHDEGHEYEKTVKDRLLPEDDKDDLDFSTDETNDFVYKTDKTCRIGAEACGSGTVFDQEKKVCVADGSQLGSCGEPDSAIKGKYAPVVGVPKKGLAPCACQAHCEDFPAANAWTVTTKGKCRCYSINEDSDSPRSVIGSGRNVVGRIARHTRRRLVDGGALEMAPLPADRRRLSGSYQTISHYNVLSLMKSHILYYSRYSNGYVRDRLYDAMNQVFGLSYYYVVAIYDPVVGYDKHTIVNGYSQAAYIFRYYGKNGIVMWAPVSGAGCASSAVSRARSYASYSIHSTNTRYTAEKVFDYIRSHVSPSVTTLTVRTGSGLHARWDCPSSTCWWQRADRNRVIHMAMHRCYH